jgi:malate synthase
MSYINFSKIKVAQSLFHFVNNEVLPELGMDSEQYWASFESIMCRFSQENSRLLARRDQIQQSLDDWYANNTYDATRLADYKSFLKDIGYLLDEREDFKTDVKNVDPEIASVAAPQLVVPINNARYAINAANARWGSLYDALYGTDMIPIDGDKAIGEEYNETRGQAVFDFCRQWLDSVLPLRGASHADVRHYGLELVMGIERPVFKTANDERLKLENAEQFCGYAHTEGDLVLLFINNGLHFELRINQNHIIGKHHPAGLKDIILEAAVTTIEDCEDSVAAVDIEDKMEVYRNWRHLIQGALCVEMRKHGEYFTRQLNPNREYFDRKGERFWMSGRSLMLVRNTGMHVMTELVLNRKDEKMPEGLVDAMMTTLVSIYDVKKRHPFNNSRSKSIYIVKPKLHGPEEVDFTVRLFAEIEQAYSLPANTIKLGIMDEERRTTVNLKECIRAARERIIFINTGFLDRTGDEIHTSMQAGPVLPKGEIRQQLWMSAYEDWNVDTGLMCGLDGSGQIGKGMWAIPDEIKQMYQTKQAHPEAGANCAWVPSPTAAVIHALHYHKVNVKKVQQQLKLRNRASLDAILSIPLLPKTRQLSANEIQQELDNNAQGILGYVVRWIDAGIGCSKVLDIHDTGLMEDRATLRISSQHMANWLHHGVCSEEQVIETFKRMARVVDQQNADTHGYSNMAPDFNGPAFEAALQLVLQGVKTPNGYTEELLHQYRRQAKQS